MGTKIVMQCTSEYIADGVSMTEVEEAEMIVRFKEALNAVLNEDGSVIRYRDCGTHYEIEIGADARDVWQYEHEITNTWIEQCYERGFCP